MLILGLLLLLSAGSVAAQGRRGYYGPPRGYYGPPRGYYVAPPRAYCPPPVVYYAPRPRVVVVPAPYYGPRGYYHGYRGGRRGRW